MNKYLNKLSKLMLTLVLYACMVQFLFSQTIAINEIMASNATTITDEDGDFEDWIELHNYGTETVSLAGYGLSDSQTNPFKWVFPEIVIQPGEFLLIWASGKNRITPSSPLHTNYSISASGEELLLTRPDSTLIDELMPTKIPADISFGRSPDGTGSWFFFVDPTPVASNTTQTYNEVLSPPVFSHLGGFYSEAFELSITHPDPDVTIVYTLDGSIPDINNLEGTAYMYKNSYPRYPEHPFGDTLYNSFQSHLFSDPITILDRSSEPDKLSQISSTWHFDPFYFPDEPVRKGIVVRAKAYKTSAIPSFSSTNSFLLFGADSNFFQMPVTSLVIQETHLFDYYEGTYVAGVDFDTWRINNPASTLEGPGNYRRTGDAWEYPANFEFFETNSRHAQLNQGVGYRIHGAGSRRNPLKSLRLYARNLYDEKNVLNHQFLPQPIANSYIPNSDEFKRILLRSGGSGMRYLRDAVSHRLLEPVYEGIQRGRLSVHFINGEYFGLTYIRDRQDQYHLAYNFNLNPDNIIILNGVFGTGDEHHVDVGYPEDILLYRVMYNHVVNEDMSIVDNYNLLREMLDVRSYVDYLIMFIHLSNWDWVGFRHFAFWRTRTHEDSPFGDGRWRTMVWDFDFAGVYDNVAGDLLLSAIHPDGGGTYWPFEMPERTMFLVNLLESSEFKNYFINRFSDHINTTFSPERIQQNVINEYNELLINFAEHNSRWQIQSVLMSEVESFINFGCERPIYQRQQIREHFDIESELDVTLDVNDSEAGYIRINTINITSDTPGVPEEPYPWIGIYFHNIPIEVEAIANPGYAFSHWTGDANSNDVVLGLTPTGNISLTAHFVPLDIPEPELIHYWHFNTLSGTVVSVESDFSVNTTGIITYPGTGAGFMDERTHRAQDPVSNLNLQLGQLPDQGAVLRVRNPSDTRELIIEASSAGYENIVVNFATTRTSNGAQGQEFYYSTDGGQNWILHASYTVIELLEWELKTFDLSSIPEVNENPDLQFRILFTGSNAILSAGNNRFDNFSVHGVSTFVPLEFYSKATGDLNVLSTWGSEPDGSGSSPGNFTNDGTTFFIQNREEAILGSNWTVEGVGSKVVVGDGSNPTNLVLNATLNALVDVSANATLTLAVEDYPEFGQLESNSTIVFINDAQLIPYTIYHHLVLDDITPEFDGNGTVTVQGNLTLTGDIAMPDARGSAQYSFMFTGGENQLITTNSNVLRSFNMSFVKTQGEVSFSDGNIISTDNQLTFNFVDDALFSDNGITIYAGNSVNIGGDSDAYDFTGTLILAGTEEGIVKGAGAGNNFNIRETGSINTNPVAAINNLVISVPNTGGEFRLRDGSTDEFIIKGDFIVESGAAGRIRFYGNDVFVGGDFIIEEGFAGTLDPLLSLALKGIEQQEVLSSLNLNTAELIVDNPAGILLDAQVNISAELTFENGILHLTEDALVRLGLSATASGFAESQYINGRLVFTVNNLESLELFYPVGTQSNFVPFSFEVSHDNTDEVVYIGRVKAFEPLESGLDETLEFVLEDYQYELDFEGLPEIAQSRIIIPFDEPTLGFDPTLLRIAKLEAGSWMNLGGLIEGASIGSTESFTLPGIFALAKAATEPEFPESLTLQDITLDGASDTCFAATQTITLAGDGTTLTVQDGAIVKIIAGENIIAHPQTHFESGSQVHLYIDETGTWCVQPESLVASKNIEHWFDEKLIARVPFVFSVYPNPTSGQLTIKLHSDEPVGMVMIDIFNLMGEKLFSREFSGMNNQVINISEFPKGIYILRLISGTEHEIKKILKY